MKDKRSLWIGMLLVLLLGSCASTATNVALAADSNSTGMKLPQEINLTAERTPIYDDMDGEELYEAAPQTVKVAGAENNWNRKLLSGSKVWFQIKTSNEDKWALLQNPQFEEPYYDYLVLMQEERLFASRPAGRQSLGTISPQVVRSVFTDGEYYLIETWLGYKWIHPKHSNIQQAQYYGPNSSGLTAQLRTITPMFHVPDEGSEAAGILSPQQVWSKVTLNNDEWLYIDTWEGKRWINPRIAYPPDLRTEERSLTLTESAIAYEHPDKQARALGTLTPQKVAVFEHGGGWHHIHSAWLGDCWIYQINPEDDPAMYTPPTVVTPQVITGVKKSYQYELGSGWRNSPFDLTIFVQNGEMTDPEGFFSRGQEVGLHFAIRNVSNDELELNPMTSFEVEINRQIETGQGITPELVWSGKISASSGVFKSGASEELIFSWDQKDSDGKQVPFGNYSVQIKLPMTIDFTKAGVSEQGQAQTAILTHFPLRISAP